MKAEQVAAAEQAAEQAQATATRMRDELRAEFAPTSSPERASTPGTGEWIPSGEPKIQQRHKQDGSTVYRARSDSKVSPSFPTIEEAQGWLAGDRGAEGLARARGRA